VTALRDSGPVSVMPPGNGNGYAADAKLIQDFMRRQELHNAQVLREMAELRDDFAERMTRLENDFTTRMTRLETQRSAAVAAIGLISGIGGFLLGAALKKFGL
jgi:hypothetical protein